MPKGAKQPPNARGACHIAFGLLLVGFEFTDKMAHFRVEKTALKHDFTHIVDFLQERLEQMKGAFYKFTGFSLSKLDVNRLYWRKNDNFVFLTPKGGHRPHGLFMESPSSKPPLKSRLRVFPENQGRF